MERLKEGLSDTFRILDFQEDLIEAGIRRTMALADFNQGLANLYRAMGMNLGHHNIATVAPEKKSVHIEHIENNIN
jgi:outer membrane protein TolC